MDPPRVAKQSTAYRLRRQETHMPVFNFQARRLLNNLILYIK